MKNFMKLRDGLDRLVLSIQGEVEGLRPTIRALQDDVWLSRRTSPMTLPPEAMAPPLVGVVEATLSSFLQQAQQLAFLVNRFCDDDEGEVGASSPCDNCPPSDRDACGHPCNRLEDWLPKESSGWMGGVRVGYSEWEIVGRASFADDWVDLLDRYSTYLTQEQHKAIRLRHVEGRSGDEVGRILGVSRRSANALVERGTQRIREAQRESIRWGIQMIREGRKQDF